MLIIATKAPGHEGPQSGRRKMAKKNTKKGKIDFSDYELEWGNKGITIRVTDYHAGPLTLSWELVLDLAQRAGLKPPPK
jgi:hypothetical protein